MYKKILISLGLLVLLVGFVGVQSVEASDQGGWYDDPVDALANDRVLPHYNNNVDLDRGDEDKDNDVGGCSLISFGDYQLHLYDAGGTQKAGFYRVRIESNSETANLGDNQWAVQVRDAVTGDELGCMVAEDGLVDMVVPVAAKQGVIIDFASVGNYAVFEEEDDFTAYVARFVNGGGLIIDMEDDEGDVVGRKVQASSETKAYWGVEAEDDFDDLDSTYDANVFFIDVPDGTYNLGIEDTDKPFVYYEPDVEAVGFESLTPQTDATISNLLELDACGPDDVSEVWLNLNEGYGFLYEDLTVGTIGVAGDLTFYINPGYYWDLAVLDNTGDFNYFLVVNGFSDAMGDLQFFLCDDGAQIVELLHDEDWDSAKLTLDPYGNLNERDFWFTEGWDATTEGYEGETFFLVAKNGCCAEAGPFEPVVKLDHYDADDPVCPDCVEEHDFPCDYKFDFPWIEPSCDEPLCPEYYESVEDDSIKWWYTFTPSVSPWMFEHESVEDYLDWWGDVTLPLPLISYASVFGDGPFWTDAGVSKMEYVAGETVDLTNGGDWYDANDNILEAVEIWEYDKDLQKYVLDTDVDPVYEVVENLSGKVAEDLDAITEIGRYKFSWWQEHGYLGDIFGHESDFEQECCGCCEDTCMEPCPYWERSIRLDGGEALFAISPVDVRMNQGWPWSWVMAMYEMDLTSGVSATQYGPSGEVTRAQMAGFLANVMREIGGLEPLGTSLAFADVPEDYWAVVSIQMLRDYNVTIGVGGNMYAPEAPVTRAQMAIFIENAFRAIKTYGGVDFYWDENQNVFFPGTTFIDVPSDHWANLQIEELAFDGLTSGCYKADGNVWYCPEDSVTRGQMATFISNAIQLDLKGFWPIFAPEK